jgi:hypothetical protein
MEEIRFRPGLSHGLNEAYLEEFTQMARMRRALPVQVLQGNVLQAISVAKENNLGTVSLYRNMDGEVSRGIVIHDSKVDMEKLPVNLPSGMVAAEAVRDAIRARTGPDDLKHFRVWGGIDPQGRSGDRFIADIIIRFGANSVTIDMIPLRRTTYEFWSERPGLFEAVHGTAMPPLAEVKHKAARRPGQKHAYLSTFGIDDDEGQDRLYRVLTLMDGLPLQVDGSKREFVNEAIARINRISAGVEQAYQPAPLAELGQAADPDMGGADEADAPDEDFEMDDVRWEG